MDEAKVCGICGIVTSDSAEHFERAVVERMRDTLFHRGPDDCGTYLAAGVALGHRRLSIIDLRREGRQPMENEDGSIRIVFNGEIYNFWAHRRWLEERGHRFRSRTDTEVIIHLYEELGVDCLARLRGMFAFAIWDEGKRLLFMARDRLGKKPVFYWFDGRRLIFGSEPKAILAHPAVACEPDLQAINYYLALGYVPSPLSAFKGIRKLPPAHYLTFQDGRLELRRYWRLDYLPKLKMSEQEACEELIRRLKEAVKLRMISDVPLGAFLSGGVDSSAVVALMAEFSAKPVKTFSIGFKERAYDETAYARMVAERFGTDHHEFQVEPDATEVLDKLAWHYNEPFADPAALPTYYLSKLTREHVTVALNGDAGDENFAGYGRYPINMLASYMDHVPRLVRALAGGAIRGAASLLDGRSPLAERLKIVGSGLRTDPSHAYAGLLLQLSHAHRRDLFSVDFASQVDPLAAEQLIADFYRQAYTTDIVDAMLSVDVNLYLPDDLLVKVDIASMAVALEARSPMVDHEFMEFAARLPSRFKMSGLGGKVIFKRALHGLLPEEVLDRGKMGFNVPIGDWFRNERAELLRDVLQSRRARERGYFNTSYVDRLVDEHVGGVRNRHILLWNLLMLELWHRVWIDSSSEVPSVRTSTAL